MNCCFCSGQTKPKKQSKMDSSVDIPVEEYRAMGDHEKDGAASVSREHDFVQNTVKNNRIVVFSKSHCPHCDDSKTLLNNMGVNYTAIELDQIKDGSQVQNVLGAITDARTVPRIFIDGQCVGGNSDLKTLNKTGQLKQLLRDRHN
ncbi:uncharacterized protein LOC131952144 isoform X2 [Physella acuta]|uniref:uncharacterized protein LOC131952144 isoform X2 n=1 Tax=Physella acuta TaxID=109671 RepID=UPI0027DC2910|nr:uncharacterized protein LOC131952144 isoform X2 [Physella acuta]